MLIRGCVLFLTDKSHDTIFLTPLLHFADLYDKMCYVFNALKISAALSGASLVAVLENHGVSARIVGPSDLREQVMESIDTFTKVKGFVEEDYGPKPVQTCDDSSPPCPEGQYCYELNQAYLGYCVVEGYCVWEEYQDCVKNPCCEGFECKMTNKDGYTTAYHRCVKKE